MTVVERRERNGSRDQFPIGMRVLAVDDDPTCLKVLELLLLRCQYHVTTTNQAIKALGMLRENKDHFDLVISDVHMPDMDGFKLLELVGLEMDLPVIMLSANGETDAVMKGITHGACDYLLKPVRLEELKNIWQHVIRRKKFDTRDQNNLDCDKIHHTNSGAARGSWANGPSDQNVKPNKKRKDQNEEDGDDGDGNSNENEDPAAQKKPRVVWSVELHRKFVAAVNQLGIDKAVPKRILELMNVEGITRENVASHLQKYRLYLKRLTTVANHQANMVAALRGRDTSYLAMGSLDGCANFNPLVGSRTLLNRTAFQSNGSIPRLNNFTGFGLHGYVPSGTTKTCLQTTQATQQGTLIPRLPTPLEVNRFQQPKAILEPSNCLLGGFSTNSLTNVTKSPHILTRNQQQTESFEIGITGSSLSSDLGRCDETWQGAFQSTIYPTSLPSSHGDTSSVNIKDHISPMVSQLGSSSCDVSSSSVVMTRNDALANAQNQANTILTTRNYNGDANLLDFRSPGNSNLSWEEPNLLMSNFHINDQNVGNQQLGNGFSKTMDLSVTSQTNFGAPFPMQCSKSDKAIGAIQAHYKDRPLFEDMKLQGEFSSGGSELDDVVANATIKPEGEDFTFIEGDCSDFYPFGACM